MVRRTPRCAAGPGSLADVRWHPSTQDFDLRFDVSNAATLQAAIAPGERSSGLLAVWAPTSQQQWRDYLRTYVAGVRRFRLREGDQPQQQQQRQQQAPGLGRKAPLAAATAGLEGQQRGNAADNGGDRGA